MTKQQKARAHLARAQELLKSGEAFGAMDYEKLPLIAQILIEQKLEKSVLQNLARAGLGSMHSAFQALRDLDKGWRHDNASVMADADLVRRASIFSPKVFGYAAESLQNNKALATEMFEKDPKSLKAYVSVLDELPEMFTEMLASKDFVSIREMFINKLNVPYKDKRISTDDMSTMTPKTALRLFQKFIKIERDRRYFDSLKRLDELKYGVLGRELVDQDSNNRLEFLRFSYEVQLRNPNQSWSDVKENMRKTWEEMKSYEDDPKRPSIFTT